MRSLSFKLTLAFLIVGLTGAALVALFSLRNTTSAFDQFRLTQSLDIFRETAQSYYEETGSWQGIGNPQRRPRNSNGPSNGLPPHVLADAQGRVVIPFPPYRPGQSLPANVLARGDAIVVDGVRVGTVFNVGTPGRTEQDTLFLAQLSRALIWAALGATLFALILGLGLARTFTRPLVALTHAARRIAGGDFGQSVPVESQDEIGQLAGAFNQMSSQLAQSARLRRQMTADIAHELRSPLSVLMGYTESLSDGVLQPTDAILRAMHAESRLLSHLVDDLRILSLADAGELTLNRTLTPVAELLERAAASHRPKAQAKGIHLHLEISPHLPAIFLDPERCLQVLGNLLGNAIRYTPVGGAISVRGLMAGDRVLLQVADTGQGIPPDQLPHIFDRFYRADSARTISEAESGLGLSIAKSLVELHGGSLTAESVLGQGTVMSVWLPFGGVNSE